ncbi:hypothetical protein ACFFX0_08850 [Citricoccus parietis]|uniref:Uncharacterized protein n=1 Tax=Citricoccus parietis TaxID=592307 RepID=A0ABV5FX79_9MICC
MKVLPHSEAEDGHRLSDLGSGTCRLPPPPGPIAGPCPWNTGISCCDPSAAGTRRSGPRCGPATGTGSAAGTPPTPSRPPP